MASCCSGSCCGAVVLYLGWCLFCENAALWSRFTEVPWECAGQPLPANDSGVRVLVAGFVKTGTRTMAQSLHDIGLNNAYHSEDFGMFLWQKHVDSYFLQRNGGSWRRLPKNAHPLRRVTTDLDVLQGTSPEELAAAFSRCRVQGMAFDGLERLFLPLYAVSPHAKVVMLSWRSYEEWRRSWDKARRQMAFELFALTTLISAGSALPWHAVLVPFSEAWFGGKIRRAMERGGPPMLQSYDASVGLMQAAFGNRRIIPRWLSGLHLRPENEEEYLEYYRRIRNVVPAEDILEWDMKTGTYEELCKFVGVQPCPKSGKLRRARANFAYTADFIGIALAGVVLWTSIHCLNWQIFRRMFAHLRHFYRHRRRRKAD